ncbi:hypothetical protein SHIRM173S_12732 [Streptomyces hirsutus]
MVSVAGGSGSRSYTSRWKAMLHMSTRMGSTRVSVAWSPRKGSSPAPLKDLGQAARSSSDHSAGAHRPTTVSYASLSSSRMPPRSTESSPMKDAPTIATGRWASNGSRFTSDTPADASAARLPKDANLTDRKTGSPSRHLVAAVGVPAVHRTAPQSGRDG